MVPLDGNSKLVRSLSTNAARSSGGSSNAFASMSSTCLGICHRLLKVHDLTLVRHSRKKCSTHSTMSRRAPPISVGSRYRQTRRCARVTNRVPGGRMRLREGDISLGDAGGEHGLGDMLALANHPGTVLRVLRLLARRPAWVPHSTFGRVRRRARQKDHRALRGAAKRRARRMAAAHQGAGGTPCMSRAWRKRTIIRVYRPLLTRESSIVRGSRATCPQQCWGCSRSSTASPRRGPAARSTPTTGCVHPSWGTGR